MTAYVALLRAVNVGGTGKLPIQTLAALCIEAGFEGVRTYIASGNVVFSSSKVEAAVKTNLEARLTAFAGRKVDVMVRTHAQMQSVLATNPFPSAAPNRMLVTFLDAAPTADLGIMHQAGEEIVTKGREIYIHYGDGMGQSKLVVKAAKPGTARNLNTVAKLCEMAAQLSG